MFIWNVLSGMGACHLDRHIKQSIGHVAGTRMCPIDIEEAPRLELHV
jgi:hypothetical protein